MHKHELGTPANDYVYEYDFALTLHIYIDKAWMKVLKLSCLTCRIIFKWMERKEKKKEAQTMEIMQCYQSFCTAHLTWQYM